MRNIFLISTILLFQFLGAAAHAHVPETLTAVSDIDFPPPVEGQTSGYLMVKGEGFNELSPEKMTLNHCQLLTNDHIDGGTQYKIMLPLSFSLTFTAGGLSHYDVFSESKYGYLKIDVVTADPKADPEKLGDILRECLANYFDVK